MKIPRRYTTEGQSPYHGIDFDRRTSEIRNPDGSTVFRQDGIAVPSAWSAVATDILAQKYFRKAGVPQVGTDGKPLLDNAGRPVLGGERDARQVFHRLAGWWTHWGERHGYFDGPGRRPRLLRRAVPHARGAGGGAELAAVVQHGPALGVRHHRPGAGPLLRRARPRAPSPGRPRPTSGPQPQRLLHPVGAGTTSSTRAGSWTSGCARRGSSSTARARAPTSPSCAARTSRCRAAAGRRA